MSPLSLAYVVTAAICLVVGLQNLLMALRVKESREALADRDGALRELASAVAELEQLRSRLEEENLYLGDEIEQRHDYRDIVGGKSDSLLYALHKVRQVAKSDATVLISGETGVGKELVARTVHQEGVTCLRFWYHSLC